MRILGIDPGTAIVGFGLVDKEGNSFKTLEYGCIYTEAHMDLEKRLHIIYRELDEIIKKYKPDEMAVEDLFFNNNAKTAISVGQARGVIVLTGELNGINQATYTPLQVKQAVVGYGRAEKKQVQKMVKTILGLEKIPKPDDAADALAIAICHGHCCRQNSNILKQMRR